MQEDVSLLIVDDHPVVQRGLNLLIDQDPRFFLRKCLSNCQEALAYLASCQVLPQMALIDLSLPDGNGLQLIQRIHKDYRSIRVLAFSMHEESVFATQALHCGAKGYLMKSEPPEKLIAALHTIADGGLWVSPAVAQNVVQQQFEQPGGQTTRCSVREQQVLDLIAQGLRTKEIAERMAISVKTVNTYKENLKAKLGLASVAQLMVYASQRGAAASTHH